MSASGLPYVYRSGQRSMNDVKNERAKLMARAVISGDLPGLYLYGEAGDAKTTLACSTLAELIRGGMSGRYVNSAALLTDIQATYGDGAKISRHDLVTPLIKTRALVIDDLGKEKGSEHAAGVVYQILDGRYSQLSENPEHRRVLIVCSNFTPAAAAARFRDAEIVQPILRRLSELTSAFCMGANAHEGNA